MTDHQHPHDKQIALRLTELGKTPDCICKIITESCQYHLNVELDYDIKCPTHFPRTSKKIGHNHPS